MADTFTVTRRALIAAPPEAIYPHVVDLTNWQAWSPWEGLDPDLERTYSTNTSGPGASYEWSGNRKVGHGRMAITDAAENERIDIDLRFFRPFKAENKTTFTFVEAEGGTNVTWEMTGPLTLITRIVSVFWSMDKMVGPDFEKGLAQLRAVVEGRH